MKKENISVVIPLYNKEHSIVRALKSVLQQTYEFYEIIVVNDGSTDQSVQQVLSISNERIRLIDKVNGGVSSARNCGLLEAKYAFVAFLDADDSWETTFLEDMVCLINQTPDASLWGGRQKVVSINGDVHYSSIGRLPSNFSGYVSNYFDIALNGILYHASSIVVSKQKIIQSNIMFDDELIKGEDLDFYFRLALTYKVAFVDKVVSYYQLGAENRAMNTYCPLKKRLIGRIEKYTFEMTDNKIFRRFISEYVLSCLGLLLNEGYSKKEVVPLERFIDCRSLPLLKKIYYLLPLTLKQLIYSVYIK